MSERIVSDPSQHGWVDLGNGKWGWGGQGSGGGGADLSNYVSKLEQNDVYEGKFRLVWDHSADPDFPFNGALGYNADNADPDSPGGAFLYASGTRGTVTIGRDGDMEFHGESEILGVPDSSGNLPWIKDFSYVQAKDFLDADGNSIVYKHDPAHAHSPNIILNTGFADEGGISATVGGDEVSLMLSRGKFVPQGDPDWHPQSEKPSFLYMGKNTKGYASDLGSYEEPSKRFNNAYFEGKVQAVDFLDKDGNPLMQTLTQAEYDAITPNANTVYFIV